jgi:hypothetical protein
LEFAYADSWRMLTKNQHVQPNREKNTYT